jgi:hypothetical protein
MKDIMGDKDDIISDKDINANDIDKLDESKMYKKSKKHFKSHEKIREDKNGKFIDDYKNKYHHTKDEIMDTLDDSKKIKKHEFEEDDEFLSKHLSEEEWTLKEKKEKENLKELISKEHELESAEKDVKAAQGSLSFEKKKIDD